MAKYKVNERCVDPTARHSSDQRGAKSAWLHAWFDVLPFSTGRSPTKCPHPTLFAQYSHARHVSTEWGL
jgi:hypothetical protein